MTLQMSTLLSGAKGGDIEKAMAKLSADRDRLEEPADHADAREQEARGRPCRARAAKAEDWGDERRDSALLREQINDLAAEVVSS